MSPFFKRHLCGTGTLSPRQASRDADALLLAVHWSRVPDVLKQAGDLSGKMVISCSLPENAHRFERFKFSRQREWRML